MGDAGGLRGLSPVSGRARRAPPEADDAGAPQPDVDTQGWLMSALTDRGISRRRFLGFASAMTALLALPPAMTPQIVKALETTQRSPIVVWLEFQDCAGNTESLLLRAATRPSPTSSSTRSRGEYHETIMAAAGARGRERTSRHDPHGPGPVHPDRRGLHPHRRRRDLLHDRRQDRAPDPRGDRRRTRRWRSRSAPAPGTAASRGSARPARRRRRHRRQQAPREPRRLPAQRGQHDGRARPLPDVRLAPALDQYNRPLFAYGHLHPRPVRAPRQLRRRPLRASSGATRATATAGASTRWAARGRTATYNCPIVRWNDGTSWPIGAGHGCIALRVAPVLGRG